ncbi:MAG: hypothetical protein OEY85_14420, partial [Rhodospirillales bacterium]|nr:hypothetical protein [Rhodospirillales bacterium]
MRLIPRTLVGRTLAILLLGLVVSHLVALGVFFEERVTSLSSERGHRTAERIAAVAQFIEEAPIANRPWVVRSLNGPGLRVHWSNESALPDRLSKDWLIHMIRRDLGRHFSPSTLDRVRIAYENHPAGEGQLVMMTHNMPEGMFGGIFGSEMPGHMVRMMGGGVPGGLLRVSMQLSDGSWLNFRTPFV